MRVRPAADGDVAAIAAIAAANGDQDAGGDPRYVAHLRTHGDFWVADDAGVVAGYCATRRVGAATMLCDLFVAPDRQGRGVGRRLLDHAFAEPGARFTFASRDPRTLPLYIRYGMAPRWPLLYLTGPPVPIGHGAHARAVPAGEAVDAARRLGAADRETDVAFLAGGPGGHGIVIREGGDDGPVVAAGAAAPGVLAHLTVAARADPAAAVPAATSVFSDPPALCLPGAHPAVPRLLAAGWRITAFDHHMSSSPGLVPETGVLSPSLC